MMNFGLSRVMLYQCIRHVSSAVLPALPLPGLQTTTEHCENVAAAFSTSRTVVSPLKGCCGAPDGITIAVQKPRDVDNVAQYWNRKGNYAVPVQAICDSKYRFMHASVCCTGSTNDELAFSISRLAQALETGLLPSSFYLVGDEAYACSSFLLTPVSGRTIIRGGPVDAYNFFQSSMRTHVEP